MKRNLNPEKWTSSLTVHHVVPAWEATDRGGGSALLTGEREIKFVNDSAFYCALKRRELLRVVLTALRDGRISSEQRPDGFSGV